MSGTWNGYTAVLIDLDGTLLDEPNVDELVRLTAEMLSKRHRGLSRTDVVDANRHVVKTWAREYSRRDAGAAHKHTISDYWRATLLLCGKTDEALTREAVQMCAWLDGQSRKLRPGSARLLREIDSTGTPAVLISNGQAAEQRKKIQTSGIGLMLAHIVLADDVGVRKPDVRIFQHALGRLNSSQRRRPCHIGDSLRSDVAGAVACGIDAIWLNPRGELIASGVPRPSVQARELPQLCGVWAKDVIRFS